jgi:NAD(P)-dependent dehydrogenase (short-subunit alcohol dehydrogenase family)
MIAKPRQIGIVLADPTALWQRAYHRITDATVEELGALTVFLSTEAAASITGIALPVDGGWAAH